MTHASQDHSIEVELNLKQAQPPEFLYHGTESKALDAIREEGLKKKSCQHVHLSNDKKTAAKVGSRRGKPIILIINPAAMTTVGYSFFLSDNEVWLTDHVAAQYIQL